MHRSLTSVTFIFVIRIRYKRNAPCGLMTAFILVHINHPRINGNHWKDATRSRQIAIKPNSKNSIGRAHWSRFAPCVSETPSLVSKNPRITWVGDFWQDLVIEEMISVRNPNGTVRTQSTRNANPSGIELLTITTSPDLLETCHTTTFASSSY